MSSIWKEIGKISNNPFISIKELSIDENNPYAASTNTDKLLDIHDQRILSYFRKDDENRIGDIPELLENNENAPGAKWGHKQKQPLCEENTVYGYLVNRKWYGRKLTTRALKANKRSA